MSTYIITGGAGFIGCNIARELIRQKQKTKSRTNPWFGTRVIILDNLSTGNIDNIADIKNDVEFIEGDIRDQKLLQKHFSGADFVLHQAALGSVPRSIEDPVNTHENNATGTLNVLLAARDNKIKRVIFASSSSVYGGSKEHGRTRRVRPSSCDNKEDQKPNPLSPYAASKLAGEHYMAIFNNIFNLETVILRYFNVYGPHQSPDSEYAAVVPLFIKAALENKPPVIFGDGGQSRSFTFVDDVVSANLAACHAPKAAGKIINIGGGCATSVNKIWETIAELTKTKIKPEYAPPRTGEIYHSSADITKAQKHLNYQPAYNITDGLKKTIEWHINKI